MAERQKYTRWRFAPVVYILTTIIGIIFVYLTYQRAELNDDSFPVRLTIIIPEIIIWFIAAVSAVHFKQYAAPIKDSPDGKSLNYIANALLLLIVYIILLTTASTVVNLLAHTPYLGTAVMLKNHLPIAVALVSVAFLFAGSQQLIGMVRTTLWTKERLVIFVVVFCGAIFAIFGWHFYQAVSQLQPEDGIPRFALSPPALLFTYALTHLILWVFGMLSAVNLAHFAAKTSGTIYKALFNDLYLGILMVYISIFLAQFFIISTISSRTGLGLGLIYGLLILATVGFVLIFRGAKQLDKIEKVSG